MIRQINGHVALLSSERPQIINMEAIGCFDELQLSIGATGVNDAHIGQAEPGVHPFVCLRRRLGGVDQGVQTTNENPVVVALLRQQPAVTELQLTG